jgi:CheY-like chemotaxis protein
MGIDPKNIDKIFEPYYSQKKMDRSGSGLGLSVVYGIVKDHRGYYDVFSEVGAGTRFVLYFPTTSQERTNQTHDVTSISGHETILVVDDVLEQRDLATNILSGLGYQVVVASGGREAVEYLKDHAVDLVLLDMIMEDGFDGLDTYRAILELYPHQKAVIISGYSSTERVQLMQELGAGVYVRKPFARETIGRAVRQELDRPVTSVERQAGSASPTTKPV